MWQILNSRLVSLYSVSCECSISKSLKNTIIYILGSLGKNKQIQQITGIRSLAKEFLELTCLLGRGSHSLAFIFYLSPQDVLLHFLFQGPLFPVRIPTAVEGDSSSLCLEASKLRVLAVSLSWWLCTKVWQMFSIRNQNWAFIPHDTFFFSVLFISSGQDMEQFPSSVACSVSWDSVDFTMILRFLQNLFQEVKKCVHSIIDCL